MAADDQLAEELAETCEDEFGGGWATEVRFVLAWLAERGRLIPDGASVEEIGVRVTFPDGRVYDHWCGDWDRYRRGVSPTECTRTPLRRTRVSYATPWEPVPEETTDAP
jgi:hypothetical protein